MKNVCIILVFTLLSINNGNGQENIKASFLKNDYIAEREGEFLEFKLPLQIEWQDTPEVRIYTLYYAIEKLNSEDKTTSYPLKGNISIDSSLIKTLREGKKPYRMDTSITFSFAWLQNDLDLFKVFLSASENEDTLDDTYLAITKAAPKTPKQEEKTKPERSDSVVYNFQYASIPYVAVMNKTAGGYKLALKGLNDHQEDTTNASADPVATEEADGYQNNPLTTGEEKGKQKTIDSTNTKDTLKTSAKDVDDKADGDKKTAYYKAPFDLVDNFTESNFHAHFAYLFKKFNADIPDTELELLSQQIYEAFREVQQNDVVEKKVASLKKNYETNIKTLEEADLEPACVLYLVNKGKKVPLTRIIYEESCSFNRLMSKDESLLQKILSINEGLLRRITSKDSCLFGNKKKDTIEGDYLKIDRVVVEVKFSQLHDVLIQGKIYNAKGTLIHPNVTLENRQYGLYLKSFRKDKEQVLEFKKDGKTYKLHYSDVLDYVPDTNNFVGTHLRNQALELLPSKGKDSVTLYNWHFNDYASAYFYTDMLGLMGLTDQVRTQAQMEFRIPINQAGRRSWSWIRMLDFRLNTIVLSGDPVEAELPIIKTSRDTFSYFSFWDVYTKNRFNYNVSLAFLSIDLKELGNGVRNDFLIGQNAYATKVNYKKSLLDTSYSSTWLFANSFNIGSRFMIRGKNFGFRITPMFVFYFIQQHPHIRESRGFTEDAHYNDAGTGLNWRRTFIGVEADVFFTTDKNDHGGFYFRVSTLDFFGNQNFPFRINVGYTTSVSAFLK